MNEDDRKKIRQAMALNANEIITNEQTVTLEESLHSAMYGQKQSQPRPQVPGLLGQEVPLTLKALYEMIQRQQAVIEEQSRTMRKLAMKIEQVARATRSSTGDITDIYHELDRKVTRRD